MKRINLRLDKNIFNKLESHAKNNSISVNQIMSYIIAHYFSQDIKFKQYLPKGQERKIEKRIRLTISEHKLLELFSKNNYHSINDEILFRLIGTFSKEPNATKEELSSLKTVNNSLVRIGNNLNQIARLMNSEQHHFNFNEQLKSDISNLNILIKTYYKNNKDFIIKAGSRWHYEVEK